MTESISVNRKKRGRPVGQVFPTAVQLRLSTEQVKALDEWIASQMTNKKLSRSEAIRILTEAAIKSDFVVIRPDGTLMVGDAKTHKPSRDR
jgi:hypothetical protein